MTNKEINATLINAMKAIVDAGTALNKSVNIDYHHRQERPFFTVYTVDSEDWDESYRSQIIYIDDLDAFDVEDGKNA